MDNQKSVMLRLCSTDDFKVRSRLFFVFRWMVGLLLLSQVASAQLLERSDDFSYVTTNNEVTITRYHGPPIMVIPETLNGLPVTTIGDRAFNGNAGITNVTIPGSVQVIEDYAFSFCYNLVTVSIESGLTSIESGAFQRCEKLTEISIPASVTTIGDSAFEYCKSLHNITLPAGITSLEDRLFFACEGLSNIVILGEVTNIGASTFTHCRSLSNINLPSSVTHIGEHAFNSCRSLTNFNLPSSITHIGEYTFASCINLESISIPSSIMSIGSYAFAYCTNLNSFSVDSENTAYMDASGVLFSKDQRTLVAFPGGVGGNYTMPNTVTEIAVGAFASCVNLTSVTIPSSATNIGIGAFGGCTNLTNISVVEANSAYSSIEGVLFSKDETTLIAYPGGAGTSYIIPNTVTDIGDEAFYACEDLMSVSIPSSVTSIGYKAFAYCSALVNVEIPDSVTKIGEYAYYFCSELSSVTLSRNVSALELNSFGYCSSLAYITLPSSISSIHTTAFVGCYELEAIYFLGNAPEISPSTYDVLNTSASRAYIQPSSTGWEDRGVFGFKFAGITARLWEPRLVIDDGNFGVRNGIFGASVIGEDRMLVSVYACEDLSQPDWVDLGTITLDDGSGYFSDPDWIEHTSARYYSFHMPR